MGNGASNGQVVTKDTEDNPDKSTETITDTNIGDNQKESSTNEQNTNTIDDQRKPTTSATHANNGVNQRKSTLNVTDTRDCNQDDAIPNGHVTYSASAEFDTNRIPEINGSDLKTNKDTTQILQDQAEISQLLEDSDDVILPIPPYSTPEEFETAVYGYFRNHAYFGAFPSLAILKDAQEWFRNANLKPPFGDEGYPVPHPPSCSKEELLRNIDFVKIDWHAITLPKELLKEGLEHVTKYLIRPAYSEVEKIRVLFRWITAQNIKNETEHEKFDENTTGWYLQNMRNRTLPPSELLKEMCEFAGIHCHTIWGLGKGGNYKIGKSVEERGQWNAVFVNKSWRLIDVHMASCYKQNKGSSEWELIDDGNKRVPLPETFDQSALNYLYEHDEFYFLTDPEKFIYSHIPDEEKWQLLARPVLLEEMEDMAYLKGKFFELQMKPESHDMCCINCGNGTTELKFIYEDYVLPSVVYHFYKASDNTESFHISPEGYVFLENLTIQRIINVKIDFPAKGKYKLELYGRDAFDECEAYETMCVYVFNCEMAHDGAKLNPANDRCEWGPGQATQNLNMIPLTHEKGIVEAKDGEAEIRFYVPNDMEFLTHFSKCEDGEEVQKLQNFVLHRIENNEAIFNVRVPETGDYTLNIYAAENSPDAKLENVCNYLVKCKETPVEGHEFPHFHQSRLGPTSHFHRLGLSIYDWEPEHSAYITADESGECNIDIQLSKNIDFKPCLKLQSQNETRDVSDYVSYYIDGDIARFKMRLPEQGTYAFSLYGKDPHVDGSLPLIYQAAIDAHLPTQTPYEFPKCIAPSSHEVQLTEPTIRTLEEEETFAFELACPSAVDVVCVEEDERETTKTPLSFHEDNVWRADVRIRSADSRLRLSARLEETSEQFTGLFEFDSISKIEKKRKEEKQRQRLESANLRFNEMQRRGKLMYIPANATDKYKRIHRRYDGGDLASSSAATKARLKETIKRSEKAVKPAWKATTEKNVVSKEQHVLDSRLKTAMKMEDKTRLKKEIEMYQKTSAHCNKPLLLDAEELLDIITLRDELQTACCKREMDRLKAIVDHIESKGLSQRSSKYVNEAKAKITRWENATSAHNCRINSALRKTN